MNQNLVIAPHMPLKEALKRLDQAANGIVFVLDESGRLIGALSDGDARRAILAGASLDNDIFEVFNRRPHSLQIESMNKDSVRSLFLEKRLKVIPLVDRDGRLKEVLTWDAYFGGDEAPPAAAPMAPIDVPVVIMAGGKGTRLAPFTNVLPKPLIPIGERTILELIIDEFGKYGVHHYFITVNYRGEMIRAYLDGLERNYTVE